MSDHNGTAEDRAPTERVVLELARVVLIPAGATEEQIHAAYLALNPKSKAKASLPETAWLEARHTTGSKTGAIENYAGKAGTSTAKVGTFRSVPLRSWRGAVVHEQPPEPLIQRSMIE